MNKESVNNTLRNYIDYLIENSNAKSPLWNIEKINEGKENKWNYIDGCMISGILDLYEITKDEKYLSFADDFVDWYVKDNGEIKTYDIKEYNIDNIRPGLNLFSLYEYTKKDKYLKGIKTIRKQLDTHPRTKGNNFWHKKIYPWQVWLDGLYMAQPFYLKYEVKYNQMEGCIDSFNQFLNVEKFMKDSETGLYYHAYDESRSMFWADKKTGCSKNFWLRAIGWFLMALVDSLEVMDEQLYYEYRTLEKILKELVDSILKWQDESGMFYQIINEPNYKGNYLETSGSGIIAYGILKAIRLKFLPKKYYIYGEKAFYGTANKYMSLDENNNPVLDGICLVAGLGGKDKRDGTIEYYLREPIVKNDAKGVAPLLMAYTEILRKSKV